SQCYYVGQYAEWVSDCSPQVAHNGPQDATSHAAWSGRITFEYDSKIAKTWTDAHELSSKYPDGTTMDQHNNKIGRNIGSNSSPLNSLKNEIKNAYENDKLCTSLFDC